ncbi:MAG: hypothetical protein QME96_17455, partial [Myxococcota bacterium]|nr:hypothetical protein [Myxococcota bacterium]
CHQLLRSYPFPPKRAAPNPDADWRVAHQMGGAGGGFAWPDLQFAADGHTISFSLRDTLAGGPPVRYLHRVDGSIAAAVFERAVDDLLSLLLERLSARRADADELDGAWHEVREERGDPAATVRRRREALLGLDPDAVAVNDLASIAASGAWMGDAALEETMAVARASGIHEAIGNLRTWSTEPAPELDLAAMGEIRRTWWAARRAFAQPWERGAGLAQLARTGIGLAPDDPVQPDRLAELLRHDVTADRTDGGTLAAGFRSAQCAHRVKFRGIRRHPTSRRFEAARMLADFLDGPTEDAVLPVTDAATARQKVQRSFAQEFLCPAEALARMLPLPSPSDAELEAVADHFGVSDFTVRSALVNRGLADRRLLPPCRRG